MAVRGTNSLLEDKLLTVIHDYYAPLDTSLPVPDVVGIATKGAICRFSLPQAAVSSIAHRHDDCEGRTVH